MSNLENYISKRIARELPVSYDQVALLINCSQLTTRLSPDCNSIAIYGYISESSRLRIESKQTESTTDITAHAQVINNAFSAPFEAKYANHNIWTHQNGIAETGDIARLIDDQCSNIAIYGSLLDTNPSIANFHKATQDAFLQQRNLGGELIRQYKLRDMRLDTTFPESPFFLEAVREYYTQLYRRPKGQDNHRKQFVVREQLEIDDRRITKTLVMNEAGKRVTSWIELQSTHPHLADIMAATDLDNERDSLLENLKIANHDFSQRVDRN